MAKWRPSCGSASRSSSSRSSPSATYLVVRGWRAWRTFRAFSRTRRTVRSPPCSRRAAKAEEHARGLSDGAARLERAADDGSTPRSSGSQCCAPRPARRRALLAALRGASRASDARRRDRPRHELDPAARRRRRRRPGRRGRPPHAHHPARRGRRRAQAPPPRPDRARAATCSRDYRRELEQLGAERTLAVATSAVRDAENGEAFLGEVEWSYGFATRLLSGDEEAALTLRGVGAARAPARSSSTSAAARPS